MTVAEKSRFVGTCTEKRCLFHLGLLVPKTKPFQNKLVIVTFVHAILKDFGGHKGTKGKVIKRQKQVESLLLNSVKGINKLSSIALGASIGS